jgi:hypothetical protein
MVLPAWDESCSGNPTPEMLAGIYFRMEGEEDFTVRPCQAPQTPVDSATNGAGGPTTEQLAGVYLQVEAAEDLTVYPRPGVAKTQHS